MRSLDAKKNPVLCCVCVGGAQLRDMCLDKPRRDAEVAKKGFLTFVPPIRKLTLKPKYMGKRRRGTDIVPFAMQRGKGFENGVMIARDLLSILPMFYVRSP